MPGMTKQTSQQLIDETFDRNALPIFVGGTGCPFVTTDTCAVIRALQIGARQVWKGSKTDFVYTCDPKKDTCCTPLPRLSYNEALEKRLQVMDATALTLARDHDMITRVFNIFAPQALITASTDTKFGSTITNEKE